MRTLMRAVTAAGVSAAFLLMTGCASSAHEPAEKFILVADNTKIAYWQSALQGLTKAVNEMKVHGEMQGPDGHDPQGEHQAFQRAIAEKPSESMVSATDASVIGPDIDAALHAGIPVITLDSDAPDSKRLFFIGTDNFNAGSTGGSLTSKLIGGKGNVVIFTIASQANLKDRLHGYEASFAEHPGIHVMQVIDMNGNSDIAFDNAKKLIDTKAKVDAFVCLEALSCPAVADVVNRSNMGGKVTIIAMDTDPATLDWIKKGVISATIAQKPWTMAYYGTKLVDEMHHHPPNPLISDWRQNSYSPVPQFVDTGAFVVDKNNAGSVSQAPQ